MVAYHFFSFPSSITDIFKYYNGISIANLVQVPLPVLIAVKVEQQVGSRAAIINSSRNQLRNQLRHHSAPKSSKTLKELNKIETTKTYIWRLNGCTVCCRNLFVQSDGAAGR
jgi:hypothetical protein